MFNLVKHAEFIKFFIKIFLTTPCIECMNDCEKTGGYLGCIFESCKSGSNPICPVIEMADAPTDCKICEVKITDELSTRLTQGSMFLMPPPV